MCPHWQLKPCSLLNWQHHQLVCPPSCWKQHCLCCLKKMCLCFKKTVWKPERSVGLMVPSQTLSLLSVSLLNKAFMPGFLSQGHPAAFQEEKVQPHLRVLTLFSFSCSVTLFSCREKHVLQPTSTYRTVGNCTRNASCKICLLKRQGLLGT